MLMNYKGKSRLNSRFSILKDAYRLRDLIAGIHPDPCMLCVH